MLGSVDEVWNAEQPGDGTCLRLFEGSRARLGHLEIIAHEGRVAKRASIQMLDVSDEVATPAWAPTLRDDARPEWG
ncbi:hypothetical protein Lfu02_76340 [Longispora fulva]|nr:hypothetical protein Lfu02_76340 [Longispora fulva]